MATHLLLRSTVAARGGLALRPQIAGTAATVLTPDRRRLMSDNRSKIGQTSVFYQSGLKISELPLVVKKVKDVLNIVPVEEREQKIEKFLRSFDDFDNSETQEIIAGLKRCFTVNGVFRLLETIPAEEVTPSVAIEALKLILAFKSDPLNNEGSYRTTMMARRLEVENGSETFLRFAFLNMLLDIVLRSRSAEVLISGLELCCQPLDLKDPQQNKLLCDYKDKLFEEILVLITDGHFDLVQICQVISKLSNFSDKRRQCYDAADKLWYGLMNKAEKELNAETIMHVVNVLPHLGASRSLVGNMVRSKLTNFLPDYKVKDILELLKVLTDIHMHAGGSFARPALSTVSQWLKVNIHTLTEEQLLAVVVCYLKIDHIDEHFEQTIERYIKARGCQIQDANLVAAICDYCIDQQWRSPSVLNGVSEYFVTHSQDLTTPQLHSIARVFGELDFQPTNGFKFWDLMEHALELKFSQFPPKDIINVLLSFVYLERYPLNFTQKMFNPFFLNRLHNEQKEEDVPPTRHALQLFDTAMMLDCDLYRGPFLPRESAHHRVWIDPKIRRMSNYLVEPLSQIVGNPKRIRPFYHLSHLPTLAPYIVDIIIFPSVAASLLK